MKLLFAATAAALFAGSSPLLAHEFWIEVEDYTIQPGGQATANLVVGEEFEGSAYAYFPDTFLRFQAAPGEELYDVPGRIGDRPAMNVLVDEPGLMEVLYVTRANELTWDDWETFVSFVEHKDGEGVLDTHAAQGYPQEAVREVYSRYAKALVSVGDGAGEDRAFGLLTEIVALENPYTDDLSDGLDVRILYQGEPRADAQIEVFSKTGPDDVRIETVRTDADGVARVPVEAGRTYLLDAVVFRSPSDDLNPDFDPMWETLWASLTFAAPD